MGDSFNNSNKLKFSFVVLMYLICWVLVISFLGWRGEQTTIYKGVETLP